MSFNNGFFESIAAINSMIMSYPFHYIVKFNDKGSVESIEKVIDEPFRESYERDMSTLRRLYQLEAEASYYERYRDIFLLNSILHNKMEEQL